MSLKSLQKYFGSLILLACLGFVTTAYAEDPGFIEIQSIPTTAAWKWEQFTIGSDTYLMLGVGGMVGAPSGTLSKLYKWNGKSFIEFQSFPGASSWKHFVINNEHYLTGGYGSALKTYKWNGSAFAEFQSVTMNDVGANDCEFFAIGTDYYLAVAMEQPYVYIYKWNGSGFNFFQDISYNSRISDLEFFSIGSNYYLATAAASDLDNYYHTSRIYKWDGTKFVEFQAILTNENASSNSYPIWAMNWKHFTIGTDHYLVVSHWDDVAGSKIYKWNGTNFSLFQSVPIGSASGMEYYIIGTDHYLISANVLPKIYKWNGTSFTEFRSISATTTITEITEWKHFTIGTDHYLAMANCEDNSGNLNQNSKIYKWGIRIINLSPGSLDFGNDVIVNKTKQLTLTIQNTGNSTMTVNSIIYPSGFSGSWSGTIVAGGSQAVTVTFSPTDVKTYSGTVTVNSDKTEGANTVTISGNGIADPCQCTDSNGSTQQGIDLVKANPGGYQLLTQAQSDQAVKTEQLKWDANGDGKIGLEDIIRMLQVIAGLRP